MESDLKSSSPSSPPSSSSSSQSPPFENSPPKYSENERGLLLSDEKIDPSNPVANAQQHQHQQQPSPHPAAAVSSSSSPPQHMTPLAILMNIGWFFIGGGIFSLMMYLSMSLIFAVTVVGWPLAVDLFRAGMISAFPYGRQVVTQKDCGCKRFWLQTVWFPFGLFVYFHHLFLSIFYMMSIIFIPYGLQHFALAKVAIYPFNTKVYNRSLGCNDLFSISYYITQESHAETQPEAHV